jgi:hypothetical protein
MSHQGRGLKISSPTATTKPMAYRRWESGAGKLVGDATELGRWRTASLRFTFDTLPGAGIDVSPADVWSAPGATGSRCTVTSTERTTKFSAKVTASKPAHVSVTTTMATGALTARHPTALLPPPAPASAGSSRQSRSTKQKVGAPRHALLFAVPE